MTVNCRAGPRLDHLATGGRRILQLVGEPGIGKSRLAAELAARAAQRGYLVLDGRAAEFERDLPFGVVVDALNDYLGALGPSTLQALRRPAAAELAAIFPGLVADRATRGPARRALRDAPRDPRPARGARARAAAVLALDDVHWADDASLELIGHLLRRLRGPPARRVRLPARAAAALPRRSTPRARAAPACRRARRR